MAAGGVENPRLMLLSTKATPSGVGNANDLVGRFFMDHPARYLGQLVRTRPQPLDLYDSTFNYHNRDFAVGGAPVAAYLALCDATQEAEKLLRHRALFHTTYPGEGSEGMESLLRLMGRSRVVGRSVEPFRDLGRVARRAPSVATAASSFVRSGFASRDAAADGDRRAGTKPRKSRHPRRKPGCTRAPSRPGNLAPHRSRGANVPTNSVTRRCGTQADGLGTFEPRSDADSSPDMWCWRGHRDYEDE